MSLATSDVRQRRARGHPAKLAAVRSSARAGASVTRVYASRLHPGSASRLAFQTRCKPLIWQVNAMSAMPAAYRACAAMSASIAPRTRGLSGGP